MNQLRLEADEASGKVEELQAKVKTLEQENLSKEQEITSLSHKNGILETEVEKLEEKISELKKSADDGQQHGTQNETLTRRLQLLEEEAEQADKTLREANEKYVEPSPLAMAPLSLMGRVPRSTNTSVYFRLRQTDVKAGHFERKVQALEVERDNWETKYEEILKKYNAVQKELEEFQLDLGNI